ncbi:MAG TPA: hypothetical protein VG095_08815, partial [Chthoniobacterales bacterium]|nr:hypothetical protein [Chthoniobacterales bacterium]
ADFFAAAFFFAVMRPPAAGKARQSSAWCLCRERVEQMGGKFTVASARGKGTRLTIVLPYLQPAGA